MQNMQLIGAIDLGLRLLEQNSPTQRIRRIHNARVLVLHTHIQRGVVRKTVREQGIGAHVARRGTAARNSHSLLPDGPRIGYFKNSSSGIKEFCQVGEIDVCPHVIRAEVAYGINRTQIDLTRDSLAGFDLQRRLRIIWVERSYWLLLATSYFEPEPWLPVGIVQINIASREIGDCECGDHWLICYVLQSLEFQIYLNLCIGCRAEKQDANSHKSGFAED